METLRYSDIRVYGMLKFIDGKRLLKHSITITIRALKTHLNET